MKKADKWLLIGGGVLVLGVCWQMAIPNETVSNDSPPSRLAEASAAPVVPASPQPLSDSCRNVAQALEASGAVRPGSIDQQGATLLVDQRWTRLSFADQSAAAECISHRIAGGQDRWIRKIVFLHQPTGVVYGTIENTRYRAGP